jgi:hypothetical protein
MTKSQSLLRHGGAVLMFSLLAACAGQRPAPVSKAVAPTTSVAQADERLAAVAAERAAIGARYTAREAVCYDKFFVNNCLDEAKELRRMALAEQRMIEVEAEHFKRKNTVEQRDKAIAETEAKFQAEEASAAAQPPVAPKALTPVPPPRASTVPGRIARRNARAAQEAAAEPANAATRAANAAAFEERRRKSEERQRDVARRKAEREAKRAAEKARKEKAEAEQQAPAPSR